MTYRDRMALRQRLNARVLHERDVDKLVEIERVLGAQVAEGDEARPMSFLDPEGFVAQRLDEGFIS